MQGARLERTISFDEERVLDTRIPAVMSMDGSKRINPEFAPIKCRVQLKVKLMGVYLTDKFELGVIGTWQNGYDVVALGPQRPEIAAHVLERSITALEPPPVYLPGLG